MQPLNQNMTKFTFFQHYRTLYDVMHEKIDNLEFVQGVNFEFIGSLKNNCTKYLLIFDNSCEEICNSKAFVDIATAGRHRELTSNVGETLSSRTRSFFFSSLPVL